ncbi:MAG: menaquinone biosynthesis family protein [Pirellula sp.]|jgi:1,4-dihydroxy-6-naphthoate synthase
MKRIRFAISTCPNDTFAFHAMLERKVDWRGLDFDIQLLDIQTLNEELLAKRLDVAKTSFHAALYLTQDYGVFPSGSALGYGVGPLLLSAKAGTTPIDSSKLTICPGEHTTATLLFHLFYPNTTRLNHVVFSEIMPLLKKGAADFGVCIHEGRFTWQSEGLSLVEDLGSRWEKATHCPLPLGGIIGAWHLGRDVLETVQAVIHESLVYGLDHPSETLPTMRRFAQEFDDSVLMKHVDLYVNDWTRELGEVGERALDELSNRAFEIGLTGDHAKLRLTTSARQR